MNRVLILEDEYALAAALATLCRRLQLQPTVAATGHSGLQKIADQAFDVVLLDIGLPDLSGLAVMRQILARHPHTAVFIITAHGTLENALESKRLGARDYFLKPLNLDLLRAALITCTQQAPIQPPIASLPRIDDTHMVGSAPEMQRFFAALSQATLDRHPVWISGPPGSGKTHAAQLLHRLGPTSHLALTPWDPKQTPLQDSGTLLLDLRDPPVPELTELLASAATIQARVIVTSCQCPPFPLVTWHLLTLPALTDHKADLRALADHFLLQTDAPQPIRLSDAAFARLRAHDWPGNAGELRQAIGHGVKACAPDTLILPAHLPRYLPSTSAWSSGTPLPSPLTRAIHDWLDQSLPASSDPDGTQPYPTYQSLIDALERSLLANLLERFDGKPTHLAQALQMNRTTLRHRSRELCGPQSPGDDTTSPQAEGP
jgi:DNA-binding NtrC family response regulator